MHSTKVWQPSSKVMGIGVLVLFSCPMFAQDQTPSSKPPVEPQAKVSIEIPDEPKTVDPATLVAPGLAEARTVKFDGQTLKEVFAWLGQSQTLSLSVDFKSLANAKILETDPVYEALDNAPLYLLLNRLERLGLAWYVRDGGLFITSREEYSKHDTTIPYNLGDLFDAGYASQELVQTIKRCSGGLWDADNASGENYGTAVLLGDVVFIRQTDRIHREVAGLLSAIRKHGRRTFTLDAPQNDVLRTALAQKISVDFQETPLIVAIEELSRLSRISIRLDPVGLAKGGIRERTPVSLKLSEQMMTSVLGSLLSNPPLSWYLRDDALWITTGDTASQFQKTAVYDVRDLCRDNDESAALKDAIKRQTRAKWNSAVEFMGVIETPKPGILVVRQSEAALDEILRLLENYRTALRASKKRVVPGPDPKEVIIGYYKLTQSMADDLRFQLPKMILPESWESPERPEEVGNIRMISAQQTVVDTKGTIVENSVLVIRQSRFAHQMIGKLIQMLESSKSVDANATIDTNKKPPGQTGSFGSGLIPDKAGE